MKNNQEESLINQLFTLNLQPLQTPLASVSQLQQHRDSMENPFYIHPNESFGVNPISFVLTLTNFHAWEHAMKLALKSKNKLKFVDGTILRPKVADPLYAAWDLCFMLSWINHSLFQKSTIVWFGSMLASYYGKT